MAKQKSTAKSAAKTSAKAQRKLAALVVEALPDLVGPLVRVNGLIAARMGLTVTDLHCLHALHRGGPATTGALAALVGLTPGSASRMVDRLVAAGYVARTPDPADRRRLAIAATEAGLRQLRTYYADLTARAQDDLTAFDEAQLHALLRFIELTRDSAAAEADRLRLAPGPNPGPDPGQPAETATTPHRHSVMPAS